MEDDSGSGGDLLGVPGSRIEVGIEITIESEGAGCYSVDGVVSTGGMGCLELEAVGDDHGQ